MQADVAVESRAKALIDAAIERHGRLDILVNNASHGGVPPGGLESIDLDDFMHTLAVHAGGVLAGMKHAAPVMARQASGNIINTASTSARLAGWSGTAYSAAKAAVVQLSRCAAIELGRHGIRVNSVSPAPIPTGIFGKAADLDGRAADQSAAQLEPAFVEALEDYQSLPRAGRPGDVGRAILWLANDSAAFVTGQDIVVDCGITAVRPISISVNERAQLALAFNALRDAP